MTQQYGQIRYDEGYAAGRDEAEQKSYELRQGCCDDVYLKGYDAGRLTTQVLEKAECEQEKVEIYDAARLKGFEEGYDEAKEVFQKEGIEDVKAQGYDLGFRAGQQNVLDSVDAANEVLEGFKGARARRRLGGHGC